MRTSIQTLSDIELKVEVEIPAADVDAEFGRQLGQVRKQARVKGFRKGKAPLNMVKRMYADHLASETARELISSSVGDALKTVTRSILGEPSFEPAVAREGHPLTYGVHLQVKPEITLSNWEGISINVPAATIDEAAVEADITRQRESHKERVPVEDRGADTGDLLIIDCSGKLDGEPDRRMSMTGVDVKLGDSQFIPGFADELMGIKAEETRTFEVTFPEDYGAEDMAGKTAEFTVTATGHFLEELPALDDDFAADAGHDNLDAMRGAIRAGMQKTADMQRDRDVAERLMAVVIERNPFMIPSSMVQAQAEHKARRLVQMLRMQGMLEDQAIELVRGNYHSFVTEAGTEVKRYLALEALAEAQKIEITDEAVDKEIADRKAEMGEQAAARLDDPEVREAIRADLGEQAALDLIKQRAKITDAPDAPEAPADEASEGDDDDASADAE